jgi:hypothetical protein
MIIEALQQRQASIGCQKTLFCPVWYQPEDIELP